ncbi:Serine/threonine-protein phosphatase 2A regulatory subunit B'' subunit alpha [Basidiobolus ranarum]|uniref:Serine/threonine-protein phosphatase 2A regulatory subunit B'' subunit alpha n=1 Tax=Basidiobolus ranarum TaxID=34480 RepID=A0ABR2WNJ3_9FUNG
MAFTSPIRTPKANNRSPAPPPPQIDEVTDRFISSPVRNEIDRASYSPRYNEFLKQKFPGILSPERNSPVGSPFNLKSSPRSPAPISPVCTRKSPKTPMFEIETDATDLSSSPLTRLRSPVEISSPTQATRLKFEALSPISGRSLCSEDELNDFFAARKPKKLVFQDCEVPDSSQLPAEPKEDFELSAEVPKINDAQPVVSRSTKLIPRFYFPGGDPELVSALHQQISNNLVNLRPLFNKKGSLTDEKFTPVTEAFLLPRYFTFALFRKIEAMFDCENSISYEQLMKGWKLIQEEFTDEASLAFYLLKQDDNDYLVPEDFYVVLEDIICGHPELEFLNGNTTFQDRYAETVVARLYYDYNRTWTGKLTLQEFKRGQIIEIVREFENGIDSGEYKTCFSYKDFYVIYCKFWELDQDHDLEINEDQLACYMEGSLTDKIIRRVIDGYGKISDLPLTSFSEPRMSYRDFVWFILSEVNKNTSTAIEYWFRCLDIDGDGLLTVFELEYFYEEQLARMEYAGVEHVSLDDCFCQMSDLVKPAKEGIITLKDLKSCPEGNVFFDMFFNLSRFIDYESRPRHLRKKRKMGLFDKVINPWDEYVEGEYDRLVYGAEEEEELRDFEDEGEELSNEDDGYNFLEEDGGDTTQFTQTLKHAQNAVPSY